MCGDLLVNCSGTSQTDGFYAKLPFVGRACNKKEERILIFFEFRNQGIAILLPTTPNNREEAGKMPQTQPVLGHHKTKTTTQHHGTPPTRRRSCNYGNGLRSRKEKKRKRGKLKKKMVVAAATRKKPQSRKSTKKQGRRR